MSGVDDLLSRGFDAGNYANAYTSTDLDAAWEVMEDGRPEEVKSEHFRAAFVIGFFSSYEDDEVPGDALEELESARAEYGPRMRRLGIAVD